MKTAVLISLLPLLSVFHRFRGGGLIVWRAPIHRRYIVSALLGAVLYSAFSWHISVFIALQYLLLVLLPWGRWYTIGNAPRELSGEPDVFESFLERITDSFNRATSDYIAFTLRNLICLLPCFVAAYLMRSFAPAAIALILAILVTECYRIAWAVFPESTVPTIKAEWFAGFNIACAIVCGIALL